MSQPIPTHKMNSFQLFAAAFVLLLSKIEQVLYISIPANILKFLLYSAFVWILSQFTQVQPFSILVVTVFFLCIYFINSFLTTLYTVFLFHPDQSLSEAAIKSKRLFKRIGLSDSIFLLFSFFFYIPLLSFSSPYFTINSVQETQGNLSIFIILGVLIWFLFLFIPYHGKIRNTVILEEKEAVWTIWKKSYRNLFSDYSVLFIYYSLFGICYLVLNPGLSNYLLFQVLMVVFIPFQSALDTVSYKRRKEVEK